MKPTKLPSGSWRVRLTRGGKTYSFTAETRSEAIKQASLFLAEGDRAERNGITVEEAIQKYIDSKRNVLSPTTIEGYEIYLKHHYESIRSVPVKLLSSFQVQECINQEAASLSARGKPLSAKSMRNIYGLLSSAVRMFRPDFAMQVTLPQPVKVFRDLPAPEELLRAVHGTDIELPVLLAMWMSLTESEICGIKVSSIHNGILEINEVIVHAHGEQISKAAAKEYTRNRRIPIPDHIMELIKKTDAWQAGEGYIEPRSGKAIYARFKRVTKAAGLDLRFHDCRHYFASICAAIGVPEKYIMADGGWATPHVMKSVYTETFEQERKRNRRDLDAYFSRLFVSISCQD